MGETMGKLLKETEEKLTKEDAGMSEYGEIQTMFLHFLLYYRKAPCEIKTESIKMEIKIPAKYQGIRSTACGDTNFIQKI